MNSADSSAEVPPARTPKRGRPTVLQPEAVAEAVFSLWFENGYAATSWNDIADATGISLRTLLRHFSAKSDIAWVGVASATERLRESLSVVPTSVPLSQAVRTGVVSSVSHRPQIQRVSPRWLRLISSEPELTALAPTAYQPWITELAAYIHRRSHDAPLAIARALATAYQAATFAALTEWAAAGAEGDPAAAVDSMLRWLDIHAPEAAP